MINKILSTALQLYLRSQVEQVENLQVNITGKSRQILQGYIPQVFLSCDRLSYQGLQLHQVEAKGSNIGFNLAEIIKQKPFRLLAPIVVEIGFKISSVDLQTSLVSPLLQNGLTDLWNSVLVMLSTPDRHMPENMSEIVWQSIAIAPDKLKLLGTCQDAENVTQKLNLSTGIKLASSNTLDFYSLKIEREFYGVQAVTEELKIDLGTGVAIKKLIITSKQIQCNGKITINT